MGLSTYAFAFQRFWAETILYLVFTPIIHYNVRPAAPPLLTYVLLTTSTLFYLRAAILAIAAERQLDRLGYRAPRVRDYAPFGLGTLIKALWYFSNWRNHEFWEKNFANYGNPKHPYTVEAITIGMRIVFTSDEENIKAILATQFQDYGKGPQFRKEWKEFLGLSIFTTDGEMWHNSRQLIRPQFIKDRVSDLHTFESHVQVLLPMLAGTHKGATVRLDDLVYRFTLDAATDFLLGTSVDSLRNPQTEFADAFTEVQRVQAVIARAGPLQNLVPKKSFRQGLDVLNGFVGQYIDQALSLSPAELEKVTKSDEGYTFLHALASYTRDREVLRDQLVAVLLAGRDTTAVTLSWLFYELSKRRQVVEKLKQEIEDLVGLHREPTYSDLKSMRYLQHTLNETLRLYPVVPYNVRVALQDTTLPRGGGPDGNEPIAVAKDTPVGYSTFILQRREDIYPTASDKFPHHLDFCPERWDSWTPTPWTFVPFNGGDSPCTPPYRENMLTLLIGPRICIGQNFALTEMAYTVVRILQTYDRIECRQDEFPMFRSDIVLQPAKGVKLSFHRRE